MSRLKLLPSTTCCRGSMADFSSPATMLFCLAELRSTCARWRGRSDYTGLHSNTPWWHSADPLPPAPLAPQPVWSSRCILNIFRTNLHRTELFTTLQIFLHLLLSSQSLEVPTRLSLLLLLGEFSMEKMTNVYTVHSLVSLQFLCNNNLFLPPVHYDCTLSLLGVFLTRSRHPESGSWRRRLQAPPWRRSTWTAMCSPGSRGSEIWVFSIVTVLSR